VNGAMKERKLITVLPKAPRDVIADMLDEICRQHWPESQTLDFKQQLPDLNSKGRNEFLKYVRAMANSLHDRTCFFKYASAATARLILEKRTLR
jgi:hypothetical protein